MNNVRSGQLLSPFGIGQIINFPGEVSLMVCGLNKWDETLREKKIVAGNDAIDESLLIITEPRLQKKLRVDFFRKPFPYIEEGKKNTSLEIPAVRFPGWYICSNPKCNTMRELMLGEQGRIIKCNNHKNQCNSIMIPVRFVAACRHGHIQDVPFKEWVHNGPIFHNETEHILKYTAVSGAGDLGSIIISCTAPNCNASKSLAGLMNVRKEGNIIFDSALARIGLNSDDENDFSVNEPNNSNPNGQYCRGYRPWLGPEGITDAADSCGKHLQVLIRGASNIHYSHIISAIFLPELREEADIHVKKAIEETNRSLKELKSLYELHENDSIISILLDGTNTVRNKVVPKELLLPAIIDELKKYNEVPQEEEDTNIKWEEYCYILKGRNSENSEFKALKHSFNSYLERSFLEKYFDCVILVERLKETRVFTGFSRIIPDSVSLDDRMRQLSNSEVTWLPAYEVYGEGIFLKFRDDKIDEWLNSFEIIPDFLTQRYHLAMNTRGGENINRDINRSFTMIHTFAHLLIKRLCFNCGYGSSSLRERIYFGSNSEKRMNGLLIYTSSGDSEGSMGGLVRQGKGQFLGKLVKEALEDARWCSADPVCSDIGRDVGQGPDNINGAACHNCAIVPETSCEEFNTLLDRSLLVGEEGFFGKDF